MGIFIPKKGKKISNGKSTAVLSRGHKSCVPTQAVGSSGHVFLMIKENALVTQSVVYCLKNKILS